MKFFGDVKIIIFFYVEHNIDILEVANEEFEEVNVNEYANDVENDVN